MNSDVHVQIQQQAVAAQEGFGFPLIFAGMEAAETPYTECASLEEVMPLFGENTKVYKAAARILGGAQRPEKVAVYGATGNALSDTGLKTVWEAGWRQLVLAGEAEGESTLQQVAAYLEERDDKLLFASVTDLADVTGGEKAITGYTRLFCLYHPNEADVMPEAAVLGACAGYLPGAFTYKNLLVADVTPSQLDEAQVEAGHKLGCYAILRKAGQVVTSEGQGADGTFWDILDSRDWVIQTLEYRTQRLLNESPKLPYDDAGISMLENICVNVLSEAADMGMILTDADGTPQFTVDYAGRDGTAQADRIARRYVEGSFAFTLSGAVHTVRINGTISLP